MEKQFNHEEEFLRKLLKEAVIEKPSADFRSKIMMRIEAKKAPVKAYKPLISERNWYLVAIILVLAVGGIFFLVENSINFSGYPEYLRLEIPEINYPVIYLSKTMQYAFAFVALFFLQIPFLKKIIDRQYEA